jgi:hypothetical protein
MRVEEWYAPYVGIGSSQTPPPFPSSAHYTVKKVSDVTNQTLPGGESF